MRRVWQCRSVRPSPGMIRGHYTTKEEAMNTRWERLKSGMRKATTVAAEKAGLMAQMGKVKMAISSVERNIGKTEKGLGRHVFELVTKGETRIAGDEQVKRSVEKITALEAELKEKQAELQALKPEKDVGPKAGEEAEGCGEGD